MLPLVTAVVAQLFDLGTFLEMIRTAGPRAEANPLIQALFVDYGMPAVALAKAALVLFVVSLAVSSARRGRRVQIVAGVVPVAVAILAGLIGGLSNARVILG
jgi:NAD(P)-dependent dehydrogenase (short-subunit alcohol dehydrogenase family)